MPEFVHVFQAGRMNKDLDERLVPNGEYRDALNLDLANSEGSDVGALQNVKGTIQLRSKEGTNASWTGNYIDLLENPVCIGTFRNDLTEKIYWFIASDASTTHTNGVSAIAEYDQVNNIVSPILVDTEGILNFSDQYLITGINIIDNFLFWTDDQTEPKKINIEKFKIGSVDFVTHTKVPLYVEGGTPEYTSTNLSAQPNFAEEDVTVIKKSPRTAPTLDLSASKFGSNIPGTGVTPVTTTLFQSSTFNFTYLEDATETDAPRVVLDTYSAYLSNIETNPNYYDGSSIPNWNGLVTFQTNVVPQWAVDDLITLKTTFTSEFFVTYEYEISIKITAISNNNVTGRIQAIPTEIVNFADAAGNLQAYVWEGLLVEESPMFEYVFPRFAYRWKYIDNEYSCFSPFSEIAFQGGEFEYPSSDAYNVGMTNNIRKLTVQNLEWPNQEVQEIDILYKESNSTAVYVVDTLKRKDYQEAGVSLPNNFEIKTELIGAVVESNQILRPWDNVPRKAKAQEMIGNRIVYANYLQNYNVPTTELNISLVPNDHPSVNDSSQLRMPAPSVKSIRTYQGGVVYIDAYGRETPVFTSKNGGVKVDINNSEKANKLAIAPTNDAPDWATHYKFFIKETSNEYYNLALDRFYNAEDGNVWLSFPSAERNKVDEETYLILKKQHDNDNAVTEFNRYKILAIENEAPEFISQFDSIISSARVTMTEDIDLGFISVVFTGPSPESNPQFGPKFNGNKVDFSIGGQQTEKYEVNQISVLDTTGGNADYSLILQRPLGPDGAFLYSSVADFTATITIYEEVTKAKPEFEGRFFVKINRNSAFDTNIVKTFQSANATYAVLDQMVFDKGRNTDRNPPQLFYYADNGTSEKDGPCGGGWRGRLELNGWNEGIGNVLLGGPNNPEVRDYISKFQPVTRGSKYFGVVTPRHLNNMYGEIDRMVGNMLSGNTDGGNPVGYGVSPNGFLSAGQDIRFVNQDPNATEEEGQSAVYTIEYAVAVNSKRGERRQPGLFESCKHGNDDSNNRYFIVMELDRPIEESWMPSSGDWARLEVTKPSIQALQAFGGGDSNEKLSSTNPAIFETEPKEAVDLDLYYEASGALPIANYNDPLQIIDWSNCFSYGNGVESNRIRDDFNAVTIDKGPKVSTVLDEPYAAERRGSGFIFSQIYNSTSGINRLNQFIQAEPITKDLNPIYGTIQKLHARDTDLITLCEDKCFRVLANKDALFNADGSAALTGNTAVLGQTVPYAGDYGISKNPESFADYAFRIYFSDKNRGAVIRLSRDGITVISEKGMEDFFSDNLKTSTKVIGSYDEDKHMYNITLNNLDSYWQQHLSTDQDYNLTAECDTTTAATSLVTETTISFKEKVDGWTSRKSFIPESGISLNNNYYTFKNGLIWQHNNSATYNNFYDNQYNSTFNLLVNESPQVVKGFSALNYTGTQSRELEYQYNNNWYSIAEVNANQITPTAVQIKRNGWYVNFVRTNLESGMVKEFEKKEGKYFNYIKALEVCKAAEGIGGGDDITADPQDYVLTLTIDESCSNSGGTDPDTSIQMFYKWNTSKPSQELLIRDLSSNQAVICAINNFYGPLYQDYSRTTITAQTIRYAGSQGIEVGTQLYNYNDQPLTGSIKSYLIANGSPVNAALDPSNSFPVPDDYKVVIVNTSGVIISVTQYNTLTCIP